jgi:hypothetical protein
MQGTIEAIYENEGRSGRTYWVLSIDGQNYSVWDPDLINGLNSGDRIEYRWRKSGNFKNITELERLEATSENSNPDGKQDQIVRMTSLKYASLLVGNDTDIDLGDKPELALDIAKRFERYIKGNEYDELPI